MFVKENPNRKKIKGNDWPKFLLHTKNGKLSCVYEPYLLNSIRFTKRLIKQQNEALGLELFSGNFLEHLFYRTPPDDCFSVSLKLILIQRNS